MIFAVIRRMQVMSMRKSDMSVAAEDQKFGSPCVPDSQSPNDRAVLDHGRVTAKVQDLDGVG